MGNNPGNDAQMGILMTATYYCFRIVERSATIRNDAQMGILMTTENDLQGSGYDRGNTGEITVCAQDPD